MKISHIEHLGIAVKVSKKPFRIMKNPRTYLL